MAVKDKFLKKLKNFADETEKRYAKKADLAEYSIVRKDAADEGYAASYVMMKDGVPAGAVINIPKDYLVKDADIKACETDGVPLESLEAGDKYIDWTVNSKDGKGNESHLYLAVKDIIKAYKSGDGISIDAENGINIKIDAPGANGLSADAGGLKLALATETSAGAMSAEDKAKLAKAVTEDDLEAVTAAEIAALFAPAETPEAQEAQEAQEA